LTNKDRPDAYDTVFKDTIDAIRDDCEEKVKQVQEQLEQSNKQNNELIQVIQKKTIEREKGIERTKRRQQQVARGYFVKIYKEPTQWLLKNKNLTDTELASTIKMIVYMKFDGTIGDKDRQYNLTEIAKDVLGKDYKHVLKIIKSLESKGVLHTFKAGRHTHIKLEEQYFYMG